jgi:DNA modification methylase
MKPYYDHAGIQIFHGDCREVLPQLGDVAAIVTDPPYGTNGVLKGRPTFDKFGPIHGDECAFDPAVLLSTGKRHIIWGGVNFAHILPPSSSWIMWLKQDGNFMQATSYSPFELAWSDLGGKARAFRWIWCGWIKQGEAHDSQGLHPSEKPVELMSWCLSLLPDKKLIVDPYMGSGSTIKAAKSLGIPAIGIEIEEKYCEIAAKRLSQEVFDFK